MQNLQEKYKYNVFLKYSNKLENIISEKNYTPDIANMLRLSFPIMIEYYGNEYEDILFNTLKEINIEIAGKSQNMYDIVDKYSNKNIEKKSQICAVNEGDLRRSAGVYFKDPIFEIINNKVVLLGKNDVVAISKNTNPLNSMAIFVHELSHACKSNQNSINLIEDKDGNQILTIRSGVSVVYSKIYIENGKIVIEDIEERNIGLEEGINTYDEKNIMNKILFLQENEIPGNLQELKKVLKLSEPESKYSSNAYVQEELCANKLLNKCRLMETIRRDQFKGTNNSEKEYDFLTINPNNNWKGLNKKMDKSVRHTYDRYKNIFNPEWYEEHKFEIIENLKDIHLMLDESAKNFKNLQKRQDK